MSAATYAKYELLRTFRNRRFFIFSLGIPIILYFLLAAPNKNDHNFGGTDKIHTGLFAPQYYMVGLLAFGAMVAVLAGGARIAAERSVGWNRQLRLTPLSPRMYFRVKVATSYVMALCSMTLLYAAGISLGVRMPFSQWLHMSGLVLVALVPFAALGIALGHLLTVDSMGPALGGGTSLFAFLGGTWFPITGHGGFQQFCQCLPSYWLVQAGHVGLANGGGSNDPWGAKGWIVIAVWAVAMAAFAMWAYRRDTKRV
jgi:ABC-2 type transport system permease protein